jgi:hypothetical protein
VKRSKILRELNVLHSIIEKEKDKGGKNISSVDPSDPRSCRFYMML